MKILYEYKVGTTRKTRCECERCGQEFDIFPEYLHRASFNPDLCMDCKMKPAKSVWKGDLICYPWSGEFDDDDNPMKNGKLYRPGVRTCGYRDCVRKEHITASPNHTTHKPSPDLVA